jgi:hypothetical protein
MINFFLPGVLYHKIFLPILIFDTKPDLKVPQKYDNSIIEIRVRNPPESGRVLSY